MDLSGTFEASTAAGPVALTLRVAAGGHLEGELRAGGLTLRLAGMVDGTRAEGTATGEQGGDAVFQLEGSGDQVTIQLVDLATGAVDGAVLRRSARRPAAADAPARPRAEPAVTETPARSTTPAGASSLVGTWDGPSGRMQIGDDGTMITNGQAVRWAIDGADVVLTGSTGSARIGFQLDGDRLRLTGNGQNETFARIDLSDPMQAVAGNWEATEQYLDPGHSMIITHYVTLYPDGTAAFEKTEGGAILRRDHFTSFHQGGARSVSGRWRTDGANVELKWSWRAAPLVGRVNLAAGKGSMTLGNAGILEEGATLTYKR